MPLLLQIPLLLLVITAAIYDILYRRIPNWLVFPAWLVGLGLNIFLAGWAGAKSSAAGFALAFGLYFVLYLLRGMGAGDVKLMGAIGAFAGPIFWIWIFIFSGIIGGVVALLLMLLHGRFRKTLTNLSLILWDMMHFRAPYRRSEEVDVRSSKGFRLPHGAVIALGCVAFLASHLFLRLANS